MNERFFQQPFVILRAGMILALAVCCGVLPGGRAAAESMTTEEFLDYSLWALNEDVANLSQENRKLTERNDALNRSLLEGKDIFADLSSRRQELTKEHRKAMDRITSGSREVSLWKKKLINAEHTLDLLSRQRRRLKAALAKEQKRRQILTQDIIRTDSHVREMNRQWGRGKMKDYLSVFQKQKELLRGEMDAARGRYHQWEADLESLKLSAKVEAHEKEMVVKENKMWQQRLAGITADFDAILRQERLLKTMSDQVEKERLRRLKDLRNTIKDLRQNREAFGETIAQARELSENIAAEARQHERQIDLWRNFLKKKNYFLQQQSRQAGDLLDVAKQALSAKQAREEEGRAVSDARSGLDKTLARGQDIRAQIEGQKEKIRSAAQEKREIERTIAGLAKEFKTLEKQTQRRVMQKIAEEKKKISLRIRQQESGVHDLQREVQQSTARVKKMEAKVDELKRRQEKKKEQMDLARVQDKEVTAQGEKLMQELEQEEARAPEGQRKISKEIEDLKLKRDILASSLDAVRARYEDDLRRDREEEKELQGYLRILDKENKALQMEILVLMNRFHKHLRARTPALIFPSRPTSPSPAPGPF